MRLQFDRPRHVVARWADIVDVGQIDQPVYMTALRADELRMTGWHVGQTAQGEGIGRW